MISLSMNQLKNGSRTLVWVDEEAWDKVVWFGLFEDGDDGCSTVYAVLK